MEDWSPNPVGRPQKRVALAVKEAEELGMQLAMKLEEEDNEAIVPKRGGRPAGSSSRHTDWAQIVASAGSKVLSNRREHGAKRKRREETATTKLEMCKSLEKMQMNAATAREFRVQAVARFAMPWRRLQLILQRKRVWQQLIEERQLGKGSSGSVKARNCNNKASRTGARKFGVGCRLKGGGRKDAFWHIKLRVKRWLARERSRCHYVSKQDLLEEFMEECEEEAIFGDSVLKKMDAGTHSAVKAEENRLVASSDGGVYEASVAKGYEGIEETSRVSLMDREELEAWVKKLRERVSKLSLSQKYAETYASTMTAQIGAKLEKPSRMSKLTMEEEEARVKATWQQFDYMMHVAAFGSIETLKKYVSDPVHWIENRGSVVIGMSDQIPVWVKIGRNKQLYCEEELQRKCSKQALKAIVPLQAGALKAAIGTEGSSLTRTTGDATAEKYRITYEARHLVLNYFNGEEPVGMLWKGALVVKGAVHARLHNISAEGTWIKDEVFEYAGQVIRRQAGQSAGRVLESFRKVRDTKPELLEHLEVYSQPAAVVDSIIQKWMLELQAAEFPCSLWGLQQL